MDKLKKIMNQIKKIIIFSLFIMTVFTLHAKEEKLRVAVFDPISSGPSIDEGIRVAVREIVTSTFVNTGKYIIVERSLLQQVMKEQNFSNTDLVDEGQATELGRLAGANKVVLSVITSIGERNMLSIKVIDVKTATIELQRTRVVNLNDFLDIVEPLTLELMGEKTEEEKAREEALRLAEEKAFAEQKAREEKLLAEQKVREEKALAEQKAREEKLLAEQKVREEKALAGQKIKEKRDSIQQQNKEKKQLKNKNLNGHYISLGSSFFSHGYYGLGAISYEYRYNVLGINVSAGYFDNWSSPFMDSGIIQGATLNVGVKLYLSNKIKVLRSFYFNILPFCYMGQLEEITTEYFSEQNSIIKRTKITYTDMLGMGLIFGYSPVWAVNEKLALGFNVGIGAKATYKFEFNKFFPINWDLGFVLKF